MIDLEYELYHHGKKGMKWGVRKVKPSSPVGSRANRYASSRASNDASRRIDKPRNDSYTASIKVKKTRRGAKVVARHDNAKIKIIVSNTTAVAAGALRVAAAFIPGAGALSGVANAAALIGTLANLSNK